MSRDSRPNGIVWRAASATVSPGESVTLRVGASGRESSITALFLAGRCPVLDGLGMRLAIRAQQMFGAVFSELVLDFLDRQARNDRDEPEFAGQSPGLVDQEGLVPRERIQHNWAPVEI